MIKTYISPLIRKMREELEWLAHKRGLSRHWEFGDFTSHNSAAKKEKKTAERKMINVCGLLVPHLFCYLHYLEGIKRGQGWQLGERGSGGGGSSMCWDTNYSVH